MIDIKRNLLYRQQKRRVLISVSLSAEREWQRIGGGNNKKGKEGMMMRRDFVSIGIYLLFEFNSSPSRGIQLEGTTFGLSSMNFGDRSLLYWLGAGVVIHPI